MANSLVRIGHRLSPWIDGPQADRFVVMGINRADAGCIVTTVITLSYRVNRATDGRILSVSPAVRDPCGTRDQSLGCGRAARVRDPSIYIPTRDRGHVHR